MATVDTAPNLHLEDQICFALYTAARTAQRAYRPLLDELDLTYPQYLVLLVLWEQDGLSVSDLGDRLRLDSGTLSPLLRRLDARGLVTRVREDADSRRVSVRLTQPGEELRNSAAEIQRSLLDSASLSPSDLVALRDLARRFVGDPA